jgi:hypothetical protein
MAFVLGTVLLETGERLPRHRRPQRAIDLES